MTYEEFRAAFLLVFGTADDEDGVHAVWPPEEGDDPPVILVDIGVGEDAKLAALCAPRPLPTFQVEYFTFRRYRFPENWFDDRL